MFAAAGHHGGVSKAAAAAAAAAERAAKEQAARAQAASKESEAAAGVTAGSGPTPVAEKDAIDEDELLYGESGDSVFGGLNEKVWTVWRT